MEVVYVVRVTQVYDYEELRNDVRVFAKKEDAYDYARAFIEDEKEELKNDFESGSWVEDDNLEKWGNWEAYHDGYYATDHTEVEVSEEKIL